MHEYQELIHEHQSLQKQLADQPDAVEIERVRHLLAKARDAGAYISDSQERERVRAILKRWGAYVYENTGELPSTQLAPFEPGAEREGMKLTVGVILKKWWGKQGRRMQVALTVLLCGAAMAAVISLPRVLGTTPTDTPSPTLMPTNTPTPTATMTPTPRPVLPPPFYPAPELVGIDIIGCDATFHWEWDGQLAEEEYFALRVDIGAAGHSRVWTKESQYKYTLTEAGEYVWEVAICRGDPNAEVCEQLAVSETRTFVPEGCQPAATECSFTAPYRLPIEGPSVDVEASITSLDNCSDNLPTSTSIPLGGTYSGDMTNKELWILVYPPGPSYYPQSTDACGSLSTQFDDGYWTDTIYLGRPGLPEAFHIVLVVTEIGSPASDAFHGYLDRGCKSGDYWGLNLIPEGATELDSIIVRTR